MGQFEEMLRTHRAREAKEMAEAENKTIEERVEALEKRSRNMELNISLALQEASKTPISVWLLHIAVLFLGISILLGR